jgi:hypothetical protein
MLYIVDCVNQLFFMVINYCFYIIILFESQNILIKILLHTLLCLEYYFNCLLYIKSI